MTKLPYLAPWGWVRVVSSQYDVSVSNVSRCLWKRPRTSLSFRCCLYKYVQKMKAAYLDLNQYRIWCEWALLLSHQLSLTLVVLLQFPKSHAWISKRDSTEYPQIFYFSCQLRREAVCSFHFQSSRLLIGLPNVILSLWANFVQILLFITNTDLMLSV